MLKNKAPPLTTPKTEFDLASTLAVARRPSRRRPGVVSNLRAMKVRRILVLVERFQTLCALRSDPARICDLLRSLIMCGRETFTGGDRARAGERPASRVSEDQLKCLEDLELLLQAMMRGVPSASRGLSHALDGLLVQCMVFEADAIHGSERSMPQGD